MGGEEEEQERRGEVGGGGRRWGERKWDLAKKQICKANKSFQVADKHLLLVRATALHWLYWCMYK